MGNAGILSPGSVVPVGMPGVLKKVPQWLTDPAAPLSVKWGYLPQAAPWLWRFIRASRRERVEQIADGLRPLLGQTFEAYRTLTHAAGCTDLINQSGYIAVYETEAAFRVSVKLLARAAEVHDEDTGNHILRVNEYSYFLARLLGQPAEWCDELRYSAALHDVGKMSVDAAVLKKRGPLDQAEREEMNRHSEYGWLILKDNARLQMAAEIALNHHEKWDGTGYPHKLAGEAIPLSARIVQMADIYDALRSARPYKPAFTHERAVAIITTGDDRIVPERDFDSRLRAAFAKHHATFDRIWQDLHD
jgi:HD-GYP domain-containing protein (c-di-GMP phosphodiesterase class II)